jgi:hypothetical protein
LGGKEEDGLFEREKRERGCALNVHIWMDLLLANPFLLINEQILSLAKLNYSQFMGCQQEEGN